MSIVYRKKHGSTQPCGSGIANVSFDSIQSRCDARQITPQFAYEFLVCDMALKCNLDVTKELVGRMFQLCKSACKHYNARTDPREKYFTCKLQSLANHPSVLELLHLEHERQNSFYKKRQVERLVEINAEQTHSQIQQLIEKMEHANRKSEEAVRKCLSMQVDSIERRKEARRRIDSKTLDESVREISVLQSNEQETREKSNCGATKVDVCKSSAGFESPNDCFQLHQQC